MSETFNHITTDNHPTMVDVSPKVSGRREATAQGTIQLPPAIIDQLQSGDIHSKKGPVFHTAIIGGTMAVKKTADIIPFCHPLAIEKCSITINPEPSGIVVVTCTIAITGKTGVEMEALTGVSATLLTIYDMCKAISHEMVIGEIKLMKKTGGKRTIDLQPPGPIS